MNEAIAEFTAVVDDVRERERRPDGAVWELALSTTDFQPGDVGVLVAQARSGAVLEVEVAAVERGSDGVLWHAVRKPLAAETEVRGRVWKTEQSSLEG